MSTASRGLRARQHRPAPARAKGQITFEYAALLVIMVAAVTGMLIFGKRSLSGKWRESFRSMGEDFYDPRHSTSDNTTITCSDSTTEWVLNKDQVVDGKQVDVMNMTTTIHRDSVERGGWEIVDKAGDSLFD